ncbi:Major facilitator superfamily MFS_1 [metagenome]|uniref:Major facilitator superfamily MFS_1 n=1 Tax=metagenome TaxID=256318 RepID=A0A2P2C7D0_9ZZZZ
MTSFRSLAHNHDFTVLWIGQTISELGSRMSMFVFPLLAYQLTGSALSAAAAESSHLLGLALTLLPAGVLADRVDRRRLMRFASASGALLYASLVTAALLGELTIPHLFGVALLTGVTAGIFAPSEISAIRAVVRSEELPTALSQNQARQHVASLVGGPIGGALYGVTRWLPFAADAVSFAISWVLLGRIRTDLSAPVNPNRKRPREELLAGLAFIRSRPFFRVLIVWAASTNLLVNAVFFVAVLRLIEAGFDPVHIGLVETAAGIAGIAGALAAPWIIDRLPTGRLTAAAAWSFVPLLIPMALWNHPLIVALALGGGVFLNPAGNAGMGAYRIAVTPDELQGRVQSTMQFITMSTLPLSPLVAGVLLAHLGGAPAVIVLAVLCAGAALIPTLSPSIRAVPRPAQWVTEKPEPVAVAAA